MKFVVPLNVVCSIESLRAAYYYVVSWQVMKLVQVTSKSSHLSDNCGV